MNLLFANERHWLGLGDDIAVSSWGKMVACHSDYPIHHVERNAVTPVLAHESTDVRVVVGPVGHHIGDPGSLEGAGHVIGEQHGLLVGQAGNAPIGGHIDKYRRALCAKRLQALG